MTWHVVPSLIAILFVYHQTWQIETYFGWCGTPVFRWVESGTLAGTIGCLYAIRGLWTSWQEPGFAASAARIIHGAMVLGFATFLCRFYAYPFIQSVMTR